MRNCIFKTKCNRKKIVLPIRLRGGAGVPNSMIEKATANAAAHGIKIHAGSKTPGDGNCIFASVLDNLNTRDSFDEWYDGTPDHWRNIWMSELENVAYNDWNNGLSQEEWLEAWHVLKNSRIYECSLGDLLLPGVAHCVKKDILIFNTTTSAHSPVYIVESSKLCGQVSDTNIPICLAYNQVHYESLIPDSNEDTQKLVELKYQIISGNYNKTFQEIPCFKEEALRQRISYATVLKNNLSNSSSPKRYGQQSKMSKTVREGSHISPPPKKQKDNALTDLSLKYHIWSKPSIKCPDMYLE